MLLVIDVGNTNTVLGLYDGETLAGSWRITTDARATADEMMLSIRGLLQGAPAVSGIALCSTVPSVLREMRLMLERYWSDVPRVIVEPAPMAAPAPIFTGATSIEPEPMKAPSPICVCHLLTPS